MILAATAAIAVSTFVVTSGSPTPADAIVTTPACTYFASRTGMGTGTTADPFQIASADDLDAIDSQSGCIELNYLQTADIDLSSIASWDPIGGSLPDSSYRGFSGTYDGGGHTISHLTVLMSQSDVAHGLFGLMYAGWIRNLTLTDASVAGDSFSGIVVGYINHYSRLTPSTMLPIQNVHVAGSVTGTQYAGGIIGAANRALIIDSSADVAVSGQNAGAIVSNLDSGDVIRSASSGSVSGSNMGGGVAGQLMGGVRGRIIDSHSSATVTSTGLSGGIVGTMSTTSGGVIRSYSTGVINGGTSGGGIVGTGATTATIAASFATQSPISAGSYTATDSAIVTNPADAHAFLDGLDSSNDPWTTPWIRTDRAAYPTLAPTAAAIVGEVPSVEINPASAVVTALVPSGLPAGSRFALESEKFFYGQWSDPDVATKAVCSTIASTIECLDPTTSYGSPNRFRIAIVDPFGGIWASPPTDAVQYSGVDPCGTEVAGVQVITMPDHIRNIGRGGSGTGTCQTGASYRIASDLDMQGYFPTIGVNPNDYMSIPTAFTGEFDGGGHELTNIDVESPSMYASTVGLFALLSNADVHDVRISDATLKVPFYGSTGFLAGRITDSRVDDVAIDVSFIPPSSYYMVKVGALAGETSTAGGRNEISDVAVNVVVNPGIAVSGLIDSIVSTDLTRILFRGSITSSMAMAQSVTNSTFTEVISAAVTSGASPTVIGTESGSTYSGVIISTDGPTRWSTSSSPLPEGVSSASSAGIAAGTALATAGLDLSNGTWSATTDWSRCDDVFGGWPFPSALDDGSLCLAAIPTTTTTSTTSTSTSSTTSTSTSSTTSTSTSSTTSTSTTSTTSTSTSSTSTTSTTTGSPTTSTTVGSSSTTVDPRGTGLIDGPPAPEQVYVNVGGVRYDTEMTTLPDGRKEITVAGVTLTFDGTRLTSGRKIHFTATGFGPNVRVSITLHSDPIDLGTSETDENGSLDFGGDVPADVPSGDHTVHVEGVTADGTPMVLDIGMTVGAGDPSALPSTGGDISLLPFAVALIIGGAAVSLLARRRRI